LFDHRYEEAQVVLLTEEMLGVEVR
jgi:hypothetical protein